MWAPDAGVGLGYRRDVSDVVFWGLVGTAIIALVIALVVIVVVTREQRKQVETEEFATVPLVDVFADAGDRLVRVRATAHAGPSMVIEPVSGEPVLWFRLEGRGHPAPVESEAELLYPFVVRRRGDIVVRDQLGAEARLDPGAGFMVPLDRFGQRDFDIDSEFDAAAYDLTTEVRERLRPLIGDDADRITSLDRLALVPDSDVTITGYVRWNDADASWTIAGDEATSVVVSTLDDESDAAHPRSSTVEADEPAEHAGVSHAAVGGAAVGGGALAALGTRRSSRGMSSLRRMARAGGRSTGRRSAGRPPGMSQARRFARMGRGGRSGGARGASSMARSATSKVPGLRQARRVTRMGSGARRGGGAGSSMRRLTRGGPAGQVRRLTRKAGGPKLGAGGGTSSIRRLFRRGRSTSRLRLPVRGPRVG